MKIIYYPIKEINPAAYNPRYITEAEMMGLRESIKKFGLVDPLIVNVKTGTLVGGHQRLKAAESEGYKSVPVIEVSLDAAEEKALNVALNSHTIQGKFDLEILPTILDEIKIELPDLDLNFDQLEKDLGIDFDDSPEAPENKNKEIDTDEFGDDLDCTCPKCGFSFKK